MTGVRDSENVWTKKIKGSVKSLVEFVQLISDKMTTTLESTAIEVYSVHAIRFAVSAGSRQLVIDNGHILGRF